jgi:hypothetical protein
MIDYSKWIETFKNFHLLKKILSNDEYKSYLSYFLETVGDINLFFFYKSMWMFETDKKLNKLKWWFVEHNTGLSNRNYLERYEPVKCDYVKKIDNKISLSKYKDRIGYFKYKVYSEGTMFRIID